ncbi:MAG TPA: META domain-containing protein [Hanamia sp.]|nr:META domain-containing protein [Hanamia sp.]
MKHFFLLALDLSFLFISCNSSKKTVQRESENLDTTSLSRANWKLIEINGAAITSTMKRKPYLKFSEDNKVSGFAGCNGFGGNYALKNTSAITISNVISTKMACPDLAIENNLFRVFENTDNFMIKSDTLFFNDAAMNSIAKFVASNVDSLQ